MPRFCTVCTLLTGLVIAGCHKGDDASRTTERTARANVLLVTLDTTRASRLGCYGYAPASTPRLDALAGRGVLFERAYTQVSLTLPSHCSLMTGRYPRETGVRNNSEAALGTGLTTLADRYRAKGHRCGAFTASYVLDSQFGLDRGFDHYDDTMTVDPGNSQREEPERPADAVTDAAQRWLQSIGDTPFFCWVHYYDPHLPYEPPAAFRAVGKDAYDGEIAFVDQQLGRLLDALAAAGRLADTIVVVAGDHGESLGEHGIHGHTNFLYDNTTHVPLIVVLPDGTGAGRREASPVELVDLVPTLCTLSQLGDAEGLPGRSLAPALRGAALPPKDCYSESLYVHLNYGLAEQRALTGPRWKYISSTEPELYDLAADPGEQHNLIALQADVAEAMRGALLERFAAMVPGEAGVAELDADALAKLAALGYVAGGGQDLGDEVVLTGGLGDPKAMLPDLEEASRTLTLIKARQYTAAIANLERLCVRFPKSRELSYALGTSYIFVERLEDAVRQLARTLEIDPAHRAALESMGDALAKLDRWDEARQHYAAVLALHPGDASVAVKHAIALRELGQTEAARAALAEITRSAPDALDARNQLAALAVGAGKIDDALGEYRAVLTADPRNVEANRELGVLLLSRGDFAAAAEHLRAAVAGAPQDGRALNHLGIALARLGDIAAAKAVFGEAMKLPEFAAEAHYNMGVALSGEQRHAEALSEYERAAALKPDYLKPVLIVVRAALAGARTSDATAVMRRYAEAAPADVSTISQWAWALATDPDGMLRDGATAVALAEACVKTQGDDPRLLAVLAAARAEAGQFEAAVDAAERARAGASAGGDARLVEELDRQLAAYRAGRAWRGAD